MARKRVSQRKVNWNSSAQKSLTPGGGASGPYWRAGRKKRITTRIQQFMYRNYNRSR